MRGEATLTLSRSGRFGDFASCFDFGGGSADEGRRYVWVRVTGLCARFRVVSPFALVLTSLILVKFGRVGAGWSQRADVSDQRGSGESACGESVSLLVKLLLTIF